MLCPEIVTAVMAVINPSAVRKPALALPYMTFPHELLDNHHPPVIEAEDTQTDYPTNAQPGNIINAKQQCPQTTVLIRFIR